MFGSLYIVNKLRRFIFHRLKEDIVVRKYVKEGFYCIVIAMELVNKCFMYLFFQTLDNLPLSHPEHFGTPVLQNKKFKKKIE